ncbi:MAG: hypothetical protein K0U47_03390 [Epsilonproteobacteria bacterium]|nr:hypothetical protein [Campylobacterota bacterium]
MIKIKYYIVLFLSLCALPLSASNIFDKEIPFKEGIVHYSVSGSEYGTKTLYIKEYGKRQVRYTNTKSKFMRQNSTTDRFTHITPKWIYEIDLESNSTTKLPNMKYLLQKRFAKLSKKEKKIVTKNLTDIKQNSLQNLKGTLKPHVTEILGFNCNLESIQGVNTYTAENSELVLKTETEILGFHTKMVATKIEKKAIGFDIFILPKNLKIKDNSEQVKQLEEEADTIIGYLRTPNLTPSTTDQNSVSTDTKEDFQTIIQDSIKVLESL